MGDMREPHEHSSAAGAPGASAPGEPGYEGEATVGDEPATGPSAHFDTPFGRPDEVPQRPEDVPDEVRARLGEVDRLLSGGAGAGPEAAPAPPAIDPEGADPEGIPDPMPEELRRQPGGWEPVEEVDPMEGPAPSG